MPCYLNMIDFFEFAKNNKKDGKRCIYIGKGPSAAYAKNHLNYGDVVVINEASAIIPGKINFGVVVDVERLEGMRPDWKRIEYFLIPEKLFKNGRRPAEIPIKSIPGFPLDKAITFDAKYWIPTTRMAVLGSFIQNRLFNKQRLIFPHTASVGLHMLMYLGYTNIYILGNDGGKGYAPKIPVPRELKEFIRTKNRDIKRKTLEFTGNLLEKTHKSRFKFWTIDDEAK